MKNNSTISSSIKLWYSLFFISEDTLATNFDFVFAGKHVKKKLSEAHVDSKYKVVTSPAYMSTDLSILFNSL